MDTLIGDHHCVNCAGDSTPTHYASASQVRS